MRKFLITVSVLLSSWLVVGCASASILKGRDAHVGVLYSIKDSSINHSETLDLINLNDILFIEGGYAGDSGSESDHKAILAASLEIKQLQLKQYVKFPILDLVELRPSAYIGIGNINVQDLRDATMDYGVGATILRYKF